MLQLSLAQFEEGLESDWIRVRVRGCCFWRAVPEPENCAVFSDWIALASSHLAMPYSARDTGPEGSNGSSGVGHSGKSIVSRALFPYDAREGDGHTPAAAMQQAPASQSIGVNGAWELGEGGDARALLKVKQKRARQLLAQCPSCRKHRNMWRLRCSAVFLWCWAIPLVVG